MSSRPPADAEWLLRRALRHEHEREMVLGDLQEQVGRHGHAWYWRQVLSIAGYGIARRMARVGTHVGPFLRSTQEMRWRGGRGATGTRQITSSWTTSLDTAGPVRA